jgi:hypothetical protein
MDDKDYSAISTQELTDILENDGQDQEEDRNVEIPFEEKVGIQGVETEGVQGNNIVEGGEIQAEVEEDHQSAMGECSD